LLEFPCCARGDRTIGFHRYAQLFGGVLCDPAERQRAVGALQENFQCLF